LHARLRNLHTEFFSFTDRSVFRPQIYGSAGLESEWPTPGGVTKRVRIAAIDLIAVDAKQTVRFSAAVFFLSTKTVSAWLRSTHRQLHGFHSTSRSILLRGRPTRPHYVRPSVYIVCQRPPPRKHNARRSLSTVGGTHVCPPPNRGER